MLGQYGWASNTAFLPWTQAKFEAMYRSDRTEICRSTVLLVMVPAAFCMQTSPLPGSLLSIGSYRRRR